MRGLIPFYFEKMWLKVEGFKDLVTGGKCLNSVVPMATSWLRRLRLSNLLSSPRIK